MAATAAVVACSSSGENDGASQAALKGGNPPGNNGTVKIQEVGDPLEIPDNDPHVGCKFQIEFRGFDKGDDLFGTWALVGQAPTGKDVPVVDGKEFIGEDGAGGANDVDAVRVVDLTTVDLQGLLGDEHPKQGYHLKLTVHADGSIGADTKHKVFWVHGCKPPPPPQDAGPDAPPPPVCGDGHVDRGEECDLGEDNGKPGKSCTDDCKRVHFCGDGHVDMGEECDLGPNNGKWGSTCTDDCKFCPPPPPPDGGQTW